MARLFKKAAEKKKSLWRRAVDLMLTDVQVLAKGVDDETLESLEEKLLASGSKDGLVRVWNLPDFTVRHLFSGFDGAVTGVAVSPDGSQVVATSLGKKFQAFDVSNGRLLKSVESEVPLNSVCFHPAGGKIFVGAANSVVNVYDTSKWAPEGKPFKGTHGNWVSSVAFSANGKSFASGCLDRSVAIWDTRKGKEKKSFSGGRSWVQEVQVSPNGDYVFAGSRDGTVTVWGTDADEAEAVLEGLGEPVNDIAVFSRGTRLAAALESGVVQVWSLRNLEWPDWSPGGGAVEVVEEEDDAPSGPNPKYYPDGKFNYAIWKADNEHLFG